jgi:hypothetical protein
MNAVRFYIKIFLTFLIVFAFASNNIAQSGDVTKEPGYVDFGDFTDLENSEGITEVILDQEILSALAEISDDEDPNIMAVLNGLKLVKANVYQIGDNNSTALTEKINKLDSKLTSDKWKRIVKTRSEDELANVYIKQNGNGKIIGLVVTTFDPSGEAAFVNIVGEIDLKTIGKLGGKLNIPHLDDINDNDNQN